MQCAVHAFDDSIRIDLEGEFTFCDSDIFTQILRTLNTPNNSKSFKCIYMNVEHLIKIDSSAISMILRLNDLAKKCRSRLVFEKPRGQVKDRLTDAAQYNTAMVIAH